MSNATLETTWTPELSVQTAGRYRDLVIEAREAVGERTEDIFHYLLPIMRNDLALMEYAALMGLRDVIREFNKNLRTAVNITSAAMAQPGAITQPPGMVTPARATGLSSKGLLATVQAVTGDHTWQRWDKWQLTDGQPVVHATRRDLTRDIAFRYADLTSRGKHLKFLQVLRDRLPDDETPVGQVFTETDLDTLMRQSDAYARGLFERMAPPGADEDGEGGNANRERPTSPR